jgi:hypothetical protein
MRKHKGKRRKYEDGCRVHALFERELILLLTFNTY